MLETIGHSQASGRLTISIGVAACPENGEGERELLHQADRALYAAKKGGRNRVTGAEVTARSTRGIGAEQQGDRPAFVQ